MASQKTERELLEEISQKIDKLIGLVAVHGMADDRKFDVLSDLGHDSDFISKLVGITPGAVRKARSRRRNARKEGKKN